MEPGYLILYASCYFGLFTAILFFLAFFENKDKLKNPSLQRYPVVTVAIPAYNEEKTIAATIESVLRLDYPKDKMEIVVVDDGSTDKTFDIIKKYEQKGVKIFHKKNSGKGATLNFALRHARGEFFTCLDADSFVEPDCLKKMLGYFKNKRIMAVTPSLKIWRPNGILQRIQSIEYLLGVYLRKVFSFFGSIHVTPGPFTVYRRSFFKEYGQYDANNLTEDIEIALRIQSNNFEIENSIDACVWTVGPNTFNGLLKQRRRWYIGFINNVLSYKHLFSPKYGNLGLFILPGAFASVGMVITLLGYVLWKTIDHWYRQIMNLIAINFDIWPLLRFDFDTFFINLDPLFLLSIISLATGIGVIYLAKKYSNEDSKIKLSYVWFLFLYWLIFAYWWIVAGVYKATNRKVMWGKSNG